MDNKSDKTFTVLRTVLIAIALVVYLALIALIDMYLRVFPFPLMVVPVVVFSWFQGLKRGLWAGILLMLSSIFVVLFFHLRQGNPAQGVLAVIMAVILGTGAGWIRKLYNAEKEHSGELTEKQEELRSSRNFLNAVINSSRDPIFVKDSSHRYTLVNEAYCRMTGYSKDELLGKIDFDFRPRELAERLYEKDNYVLSKGEIENFEVEFFDKLGNRHFVVTNETLYQDEKGDKYIIANVRDETKRKELEKELNNALVREKELSEMKSKFISMVSHEYRTPLTTILSSTDLLDLFGLDMENDERREFLQTIKSSVKYLTGLVNDVLMLNRSESGRLNYLPSMFELVKLCKETAASFNTGEGEQVIFYSNLPSKTVGMDRKLLTYILMNLLSNAVKYSTGGNPVEFNVNFEQEHVSFEIKDKGIGIPEESFPHLFEPFYRAENAANINGSGLGLSIVKGCVDTHKGVISFNSVEGKGTTFLVRLPDHRNSLLQEQ